MNPWEALVHLIGARFRGAPPPPRPQGVRVSIGDQFIEPISLTYHGKNRDGTHEWLATFDITGDDVDRMHVDVLPGHTSVALAFRVNREEST